MHRPPSPGSSPGQGTQALVAQLAEAGTGSKAPRCTLQGKTDHQRHISVQSTTVRQVPGSIPGGTSKHGPLAQRQSGRLLKMIGCEMWWRAQYPSGGVLWYGLTRLARILR